MLRSLFDAAIAAADPTERTSEFLHRAQPWTAARRTVLVGAGKAAAAMALGAERAWPASAPLAGLVVTRYGHGSACRRVEVIEAGHPLPDAAGVEAARRVLEMVQALSEGDLVLCLLSGGGSALLALPASGLTLDDKRVVTQAVLASGASIGEINCVRKHLSAIKGGRLTATAYPARVLTLAISDVPGDDPAVIASGPTVADPTSFADALAVLARYRVALPAPVTAHLKAAADETPKPGDPRLDRAELSILVRPLDALEAAAGAAAAAGVEAAILGDRIEGEAREIARAQADLVRDVIHSRGPGSAPAALFSGGETTVTVRGSGRGGRNTEFLLALAVALNGQGGVYALAADTDGLDGTEENAGAWIGPDTLTRARGLGLDPLAFLENNDAYGFFSALGELLVIGPTRTNVNDFRAILVI